MYHWTKKRIFQYSKYTANLQQMPHLIPFTQICSQANVKFAPILPYMAKLVNATFA